MIDFSCIDENVFISVILFIVQLHEVLAAQTLVRFKRNVYYFFRDGDLGIDISIKR